jgi:hypothetical protein
MISHKENIRILLVKEKPRSLWQLLTISLHWGSDKKQDDYQVVVIVSSNNKQSQALYFLRIQFYGTSYFVFILVINAPPHPHPS